MKRKIAALLATVLVMTMGATTVFAAGSTTSSDTTTNSNVNTEVKAEATVAYDKVDVPAGMTKSEPAATVVTTVANEVKGQLQDMKGLGAALKNDTVAAAATDTAYSVSAEIKTVLDLTGTAGETYTLTVPGIKAGATVFLLHEKAANDWEVIPATAGDGTITATFPSFSNYAVVQLNISYSAPTTTTPVVDETPASPKTGAFPIAAIAAGICLAGAAVCGKKVKFN